MPRFDDGGVDGGLRVPGLYSALLVRERRRCERRDPRRLVADPDDSLQVYRRPRALLDALEAGKPVVMPRWLVGGRGSTPPVALPWDRSVESVRVSPDDVVRPAEGLERWPGCAADDVEVVGR